MNEVLDMTFSFAFFVTEKRRNDFVKFKRYPRDLCVYNPVCETVLERQDIMNDDDDLDDEVQTEEADKVCVYL